MSLKYIALAASLAFSSAAMAQAAGEPIKPNIPAQTGETSDRTPDKATATPQAQQDTSGGKTSDRSGNKDVKVEHQPGAAGTSSMESGAPSGTAGSTTTPSTTPSGSGSTK